MVDCGHVGHTCGVVHLACVAVLVVNHVRHVGHGGNDVHVELAVETFLNYFHVEQSEEAATESETERHGAFGRKGKGSVVELQLLER